MQELWSITNWLLLFNEAVKLLFHWRYHRNGQNNNAFMLNYQNRLLSRIYKFAQLLNSIVWIWRVHLDRNYGINIYPIQLHIAFSPRTVAIFSLQLINRKLQLLNICSVSIFLLLEKTFQASCNLTKKSFKQDKGLDLQNYHSWGYYKWKNNFKQNSVRCTI